MLDSENRQTTIQRPNHPCLSPPLHRRHSAFGKGHRSTRIASYWIGSVWFGWVFSCDLTGRSKIGDRWIVGQQRSRHHCCGNLRRHFSCLHGIEGINYRRSRCRVECCLSFYGSLTACLPAFHPPAPAPATSAARGIQSLCQQKLFLTATTTSRLLGQTQGSNGGASLEINWT